MNRIFVFAILLVFSIVHAQSSWPSGSWSSTTNLTAVMDADGVNDLSGLHWNPTTNRLYCIQGDGRLHVLQYDPGSDTFTQIANKAVPEGPEGITQVDFSSNEFYTIDENNYEIRKFTHNANFGNMTEAKHWNLLASPSPMENTGNTGPEGIVFIPDSALSAAGFVSQQTGNLYTSVKGMGGLMFVAHQDEGYIWVFDVNPNVNNDFAYVGKYRTNRLESCDLAFDRSTGLLYILHNIDANYLEVTDLTSVITSGTTRKFVTENEYFLGNPTDGNINIEGFAITPKCPETGPATAWLCRDVENNEDDAIRQNVLHRFTPFAADGNCTPLSISVNSKPEFSILPNPGENYMTIHTENDFSEISLRVINEMGQIVLEKQHCPNNAVFDTSELASGIYIVELRYGNNLSTIKWVKQ